MPNSSKTQDAKKEKLIDKGYKGRSKLSPKKMEQYQKEAKYFKCNEHRHMSARVLKRHKEMKLKRIQDLEDTLTCSGVIIYIA